MSVADRGDRPTEPVGVRPQKDGVMALGGKAGMAQKKATEAAEAHQGPQTGDLALEQPGSVQKRLVGEG